MLRSNALHSRNSPQGACRLTAAAPEVSQTDLSCLMSDHTVEEIGHRGVDLYRIWERFSPDADYAVAKADSRFQTLFQSIESAPEEGREDYRRLKILELAHRFDVSGTSAKRYFHKVYGISIPEYRRRARMRQAQNLLAGSDVPIYEIAADVGFENASKFAKVFRNSTGVSPSEYRKRCGQNQQEQSKGA